MKKRIPLLFLISLTALSLAHAEAEKASKNTSSRTVDLGELEVTGEVRKPLLDYIDSDLATRKALESAAKSKLQSMERGLLASKSLTQISDSTRSDLVRDKSTYTETQNFEKSLLRRTK